MKPLPTLGGQQAFDGGNEERVKVKGQRLLKRFWLGEGRV